MEGNEVPVEAGSRYLSPSRAFDLWLAVLTNHQNGRDTHIRQIKVLGPRSATRSSADAPREACPLKLQTRELQQFASIRCNLSTVGGMSDADKDGYPVMSFVVLMIASASESSAWLVDGSCASQILSNRMFHKGQSDGTEAGSPVMYMAMSHFPAQEKEMGSTTFLLWMFLINTLTSLLYLPVMFCLGMYYHMQPYYYHQSLRGLWPMIMVCLTLSALSNPDSSTNFWGLVKIPNRWYPLALTGLFTLINGRIMWNFLVALAIGYGYPKLRLERLLPSKTRVDRLEQKCCRGGRCQLLGTSWIPAASTSSYDLDVQIDRRYRNFSDFGNTDATNSTCCWPGQQRAVLQEASSWPSEAVATVLARLRPQRWRRVQQLSLPGSRDTSVRHGIASVWQAGLKRVSRKIASKDPIEDPAKGLKWVTKSPNFSRERTAPLSEGCPWLRFKTCWSI
ncbi:APC10 [Symbiodinium necroappetens]|uniref:APC10 protein n=1 Tax=Symbiodinium necroappetens TaxID=1628268 RepID=A0A812MVA7_9DINO|nr:APC10 [Symbiodinium necroappetens]